ncbi:MAG: exodeoxyribonuclease VII small subunit [Ruminococcaceae bacterium]|nr:exodeoxyribonuclease VII small subunit [Oscillospiraceae bacterium]
MENKFKDLSFEEAIRRLEAIAAELEVENTTLEASLKLYEEGIALVRYCNASLEAAERKVKILSVNPDGELCESDFSGENT